MKPEEDLEIQSYLNDLIDEFMIYQGYFPDELLTEMLQDRDGAIPFLHILLKTAVQHYENTTPQLVGHVYALYMLAQLREKSAFPYALQLLSFYDDESDDTILSAALHDMPAILASLYDGNLQGIYTLIENSRTSLAVRKVGINALAALYLSNQLERQELVRYYLHLLQTQTNEFLLLMLLFAVEDARLEELYDTVRTIFHSSRDEEMRLLIEQFNEAVELPHLLPSDLLIDDAVASLEALDYIPEGYEEEIDFITDEFEELKSLKRTP